MTETATMFIAHATVLDHGYIDDFGRVRGGSFHPSFLVTGDVDETEKVVIDFSTAKKQIKALIDDKENGFDHKLWIIEGYSNCEYEIEDDRITITSDKVYLRLPRNAVKIFDGIDHQLHSVGKALARYLNDEMRKEQPNILISCHNSTIPHTMNGQTSSMFSYVHGLKDSTSWGCQNNSHGHLSFIQLIKNPLDDNEEEVEEVEEYIAHDLDKTIFINKANVAGEDADSILISYTTERGEFTAKYQKDHDVKIEVLNTETTIEYLIEYIAETYAYELTSCNAYAIMVSEGLSKGAYKKL